MPQLSGGLKEAANSLIGTSPRNRYIGLTRELPAVSSIASSPPSSCSQRAVCSDSSMSIPPRTPSAMLSLAITAIGAAPSRSTSRRTAVTIARATLARLASDPPNSSERLLTSGDRNELAR